MSGPSPAYRVTHRRYDEDVDPRRRLGRQIRVDSRSAAYPFRPARTVPVVSKAWDRHLPILDQGNVGSCEGNAETGCVGTSPLYEALPAGHPALDEKLAVKIYGLATSLDGYPGTYPPTDTGTDSTAANQAAKQLGLVSGYTHVSTVDDLLQALMAGPVNVGIDWWSSFDTPAASGLVQISKTASIRGGHALCAREVDAAKQWIWLDNSWTATWGKAGRCAVEYATFERLFSDGGEAVVPVPLSAPAPVPVPPEPTPVPTPPAPGDPLPAYLTDARLAQWAAARHLGANAYAARAYLALQAAEKNRGN